MAACRRISCFARRNKFFRFSFHHYSTPAKSSAGSSEIVIPYRIERGPTDILKQLSATVHKDFTAAHYKYEDDPYFIPSSNITKRSFALSKESGKKAARYFLEKFPDLFKCNESVPHIKAFDPPIEFTEENVTSVKELKYCLDNFEVDNAQFVYDILKKKGIAVSQELKQEFLELLCFYNCTQPPSEDYFEERYYARSDIKPPKWNSKSMANELFNDMQKDSLSYSAMISGLAKFLDAERAESLFHEMREKGFTGTVEAYNGLISVTNLLQESYESRWEYILQILSMMSKDGVQPNLYTLNGALDILSRAAKWRKSADNSLRLLAEMKRFNIDPSLGTYYYLMTIFCVTDFSRANILHEIMAQIEGKELEILHPSDVSFFVGAMEMCLKGLRDKDMAYQIHNLLEYKNNSKLLGNAFCESLYFKSFFYLLCATEDVDKLMEVYEKYIPNTYTPEPSVTFAVIEAICLSGSYQYLPKMCSDVLFFEQTERENILNLLIETSASTVHEKKTQEQLVQMVWNIYDKLIYRSSINRLPFSLSGTLLGNILKIFINGKDLEKTWSVVKKLKEEESLIIGYPEKAILLSFCELCLENELYEKFRYCVKYAVAGHCPDFRQDAETLANTMFADNRLTEKQKTDIKALFDSTSRVSEELSSDSSSDSESESESSSDEEEEKDSDNGNVKKE